METGGTLYWKWEDAPTDATEDDPAAVGPAWVIGADGTERNINGGEWITRAEAEELASSNGWALHTDEADPVNVEPPLDVEAVNARLRVLGISESQLVVQREEDPPGYVLLGSVANAAVSMFPLLPEETEESRQSVRHSFPTASAVAARLDVLARGWRDK
jgi:hypothetical protein